MGRDSISKRLGVKLYGGQFAKAGSIIIRQKGTKFYPGLNVKRGNDDTLFATTPGYVKFTKRKKRKFDGSLKETRIVNVIPKATPKVSSKVSS